MHFKTVVDNCLANEILMKTEHFTGFTLSKMSDLMVFGLNKEHQGFDFDVWHLTENAYAFEQNNKK